MTFRYNAIQRNLKKMYRTFSPVPRSPWTMGEVEDICEIHLVPPEKLRLFFASCIEILRKERGEDVGDYLEFGVFNGSSLGSMHLTAEDKNVQMRLFGFDAFEGLPKGSENEDDGAWKKGFYACSFDDMQDCLKRREVSLEKIIFVEGWYEQTLTHELNAKHDFDPGIVFIDCDTYSSSKTVLDFIAPLIKKPTIVCLDDWKLNDLDIKSMGEYRSFNEFLENNPQLKARKIKSYNRKSQTFLITLV